jgi:hypothetical protein
MDLGSWVAMLQRKVRKHREGLWIGVDKMLAPSRETVKI